MKTILTLLLPLFLLIAIPHSMEADSFVDHTESTIQVDNISPVTVKTFTPVTSMDEVIHSIESNHMEIEKHILESISDTESHSIELLNDTESNQKWSLNSDKNDIGIHISHLFSHEPIKQSLLEHTKPTNIGYRIKGMSTPYLFI